MPRARISADDLETMRQLWASGISSVKIGLRFGLDHTTVLYHLGRNKNHRAQAYKVLAEGNYLPGENSGKIGKRVNERYIKIKTKEPKMYAQMIKKPPKFKVDEFNNYLGPA